MVMFGHRFLVFLNLSLR